MVAKVHFTYPRRRVEEEGKPAYPGPELHPADGLYAVGEIEGCLEDLAEHFDSAIFGITFPANECQ